MRIDILAIGSRGDVQPYVALGIGLQTAGHRVRIVTLGGFEQLVRSYGLEHFCIGSSPGEIAGTAAGQEWVKQRTNTSGFLRGFVRVAASLIEQGMETYFTVCQDIDLLIVSGMGLLLGVHIAEKLGIPLVRSELSPFAHTRYDWDGQKSLKTVARGDLTAFLHKAFRFVLWSKLRGRVNSARSRFLSLPPARLFAPFQTMERHNYPLLAGYSPTVLPKPPDWPEWIHVTGYWFLDGPADWCPTDDLVAFLNAGPAPVFVGFGSTPFPEPEKTIEMVIRALQRAGKRGLVLAGGSGLPVGRLTDEVASFSSVPHDWLFSRVSSAVHHGGAGVTGHALRAGLPSVIVPVFADQPFWSQRIFEMGAAAHPIPAKALTEDALASGIQQAEGTAVRARAQAISSAIRKENGVARAVEVIETRIPMGK